MSATSVNDTYDNSPVLGDSSPPAATPTSPPLLPRPTLSASDSQFRFVQGDATDTSDEFEPLPPEIASADISVARKWPLYLYPPPCRSQLPLADGSFVETSSGAAARELKRRYDQYLGVGHDVRSPYAITAFVNQHGKEMYRVR